MRWSFIAAALLAANSYAADFTHNGQLTDIGKLEVTYQAIAALDWMQTLDAARYPDDYAEQNPILGPHPDRRRINAYFIACGLAHAAISAALPDRYARVWQYMSIAIEVRPVLHNYSIGVGFSAPF